MPLPLYSVEIHHDLIAQMHQPRHRIPSLDARATVGRRGKYHGRATRSCRAYVVMLAAREST